MKKIFITGGTGFLGKYLTKLLLEKGYEVSILSRSKKQSTNIEYIMGDPNKQGEWQEAVKDFDIVINLAGSSIFSKWTPDNKALIKNSRINTTKNVVEAISKSDNKKITLINASAIGYYGSHDTEQVFTETSQPGNDFLAEVCKEWEEEANKAKSYAKSVIICRFGIILGKNGGALEQMIPIFKLGLGSPLGSGRQYFSWIHIQDLANIIAFIIDNETATDTFNCCSPNPIRNKELTKALGKALTRPTFLPSVPGIILKTYLGEFAQVILKGQKVYPQNLLNLNYNFLFSTIDEALADLFKAP